jgi:hypothetical protein
MKIFVERKDTSIGINSENGSKWLKNYLSFSLNWTENWVEDLEVLEVVQ